MIKPIYHHPFRNLNKVDWGSLSRNPDVVHILEQHLDKVDWDMLSINPNAIHLLEQNLDKVNWSWLYILRKIYQSKQDCKFHS